MSPFEILPIGSSLSPEGTPDLEALASTTTTRENTLVTPIDLKGELKGETKGETKGKTKGETKGETKDNAAAKKAEQAEFKNDWCKEMSIDPEKMTDADRGSFMASFKVYWDQLNKA
jgi:hypothetical protein